MHCQKRDFGAKNRSVLSIILIGFSENPLELGEIGGDSRTRIFTAFSMQRGAESLENTAFSGFSHLPLSSVKFRQVRFWQLDSKSGSRASGSWVRIPPYPPKKASACADAFLTKQIPAGSVKCTSCVKFALRRVNCLWAWADLLCFTWRKAPNFTLHRERQRTTSLPALDCAGATALPCYINFPFLCAVV